ncbi:MAG: hypothetical protein IJ867_06175 [Clostridia bacterium]|nr:hypothetical protein [Clostridia bacterium]
MGGANNGYLQAGLWAFANEGDTYNFDNLDNLTKLHLRGGSGTADLTGMANLTKLIGYSTSWKIKVPSTTTNLTITNVKVDASKVVGDLTVVTREWSDTYIEYLIDSLPDGNKKLVNFEDIAHGSWNFSTLTSRYKKLGGLKYLNILTGFKSRWAGWFYFWARKF